MLKNYFKIALRSLLKNKKLSFINIFGLATGLAFSLLILLFVQDELSYDVYHSDAQNIHRVVKDFIHGDSVKIPDATTQAPLAPVLQEEIPEVFKATRFMPSWGSEYLVRSEDKLFMESRLMWVDSTFFDVFSFKILQGNPKDLMKDRYSILITESTAKKYFDREDPLGKTLNINNASDYVVRGVVEDVPANSHFHFDFLLSFYRLPPDWIEEWDSYNYYTYVKVHPETDIAALNSKIQDIFEKYQDKRYSSYYTQPILDIHLTSNLKWELEPNGDLVYVYIFSIIGVFILLIAAINYINLSTANTALRAKEIGVRKVSGAQKESLIKQFLMESILLCFVASLVAFVIAEISLPFVNEVADKSLSIIHKPLVISYIFLSGIFVGVVAGIFPALYLSSINPVRALKGLKLKEKGSLNLRKTLVIVQFTISIILIVGVIIISRQMDFIQSAKLGFDKDHVLVIKNAERISEIERHSFLNFLKQHAAIEGAAISSTVLGESFGTSVYGVKGTNHSIQINHASVGLDFIETIGIELIEGRAFSAEYPTDAVVQITEETPPGEVIGGIILNERAVKDLGLQSPYVGSLISVGSAEDANYYYNVIGVVKDFHFTSLKSAIKPFAFTYNSNWVSNFTIKLAGHNISRVLYDIEEKWTTMSNDYPFQYSFLDESYSKLYGSEIRFQKVVTILVIVAIILTCLGLFALATFSVERKIKEVGIRKILGASIPSLIMLLSYEFLKLVFFAFIIGAPIAWFAIDKWLQNFEYKVSISVWVFLLAAVIAMVIAFLTISSHAIKAALADPVKNLRTE